MERLRERLSIAQRALESLRELSDLEHPSQIERDAAIQRFEYTCEAVWKAAQRYLSVSEGLRLGSPKSCIRACREVGLLTDEQASLCIEMVDDRNLTVHTYNEMLADEIYGNLNQYEPLLTIWLEALKKRTKE